MKPGWVDHSILNLLVMELALDGLEEGSLTLDLNRVIWKHGYRGISKGEWTIIPWSLQDLVLYTIIQELKNECARWCSQREFPRQDSVCLTTKAYEVLWARAESASPLHRIRMTSHRYFWAGRQWEG